MKFFSPALSVGEDGFFINNLGFEEDCIRQLRSGPAYCVKLAHMITQFPTREIPAPLTSTVVDKL